MYLNPSSSVSSASPARTFTSTAPKTPGGDTAKSSPTPAQAHLEGRAPAKLHLKRLRELARDLNAQQRPTLHRPHGGLDAQDEDFARQHHGHVAVHVGRAAVPLLHLPVHEVARRLALVLRHVPRHIAVLRVPKVLRHVGVGLDVLRHVLVWPFILRVVLVWRVPKVLRQIKVGTRVHARVALGHLPRPLRRVLAPDQPPQRQEQRQHPRRHAAHRQTLPTQRAGDSCHPPSTTHLRPKPHARHQRSWITHPVAVNDSQLSSPKSLYSKLS
jgi:hypothetical protein